ncbi:MAG: ubiquinol-cytochrome C chaperone family protein [Rhodospirillales bacterium]
MKLPFLSGGKGRKKTAHKIYRAIMKKARQPEFFLHCGVDDTFDGRFDMMVIHAFLVLRRLKLDHGETAGLAQEVFDLMFVDMDQVLREMGVGDIGLGKRIKAMAEAFYGRIAVYESGLDSENDELLNGALRRNLFRGMRPRDEDVSRMADYMRLQVEALEAQQTRTILTGVITFAPTPAAMEKTVEKTVEKQETRPCPRT